MKKPQAGTVSDRLGLLPKGDGKQKVRAAALAHDLHNKLFVIVANCDMLLLREGEMDADAARRIEQIKSTAQYISGQVRKLNPLAENSEKKAAV